MSFGPKVNLIGASRPHSPGNDPQLTTIPVRRRPFPEVGKPAVLSGPIGRAPFTPEPLLRDSIASEAVGRFVLPTGNLFAAPDTLWKKLQVERPTIVVSLTTDTPGITGAGLRDGPRIFYNYGKIPESTDQAQRSSNVGTCFLSNPGIWWLRHDVVDGDLEQGYPNIDCLLIDASNPEVARRFLDQPGVNFADEDNVDLDAVSATLIPFGRYARAVTVQNVPPVSDSAGGEVVRYVVGQPALTLNSGVWTGTGFRLLVNGSVTFSGKALTTFGIYACTETGVGAVEVVRYMD